MNLSSETPDGVVNAGLIFTTTPYTILPVTATVPPSPQPSTAPTNLKAGPGVTLTPEGPNTVISCDCGGAIPTPGTGSWVMRGEWNGNTTYAKYDVVLRGGPTNPNAADILRTLGAGTYIASGPNVGHEPEDYPASWACLARFNTPTWVMRKRDLSGWAHEGIILFNGTDNPIRQGTEIDIDLADLRDSTLADPEEADPHIAKFRKTKIWVGGVQYEAFMLRTGYWCVGDIHQTEVG